MPYQASPNRANILLWVQALESGKFQQGHTVLKSRRVDGDHWRYCCLGVACELAIEHGVQVQTAMVPYGSVTHVAFDGQHGFLPQSVVDWLGVDHPNPLVRLGDWVTAVEANDRRRFTFLEIARCLRATYVKEEGSDAAASET